MSEAILSHGMKFSRNSYAGREEKWGRSNVAAKNLAHEYKWDPTWGLLTLGIALWDLQFLH